MHESPIHDADSDFAARIAGWRGYGDDDGVHLVGQVLEPAGYGAPSPEDGALRNLRRSWRRFLRDPVPGVALEAHGFGTRARAHADDAGYYALNLQPTAGWGDATHWSEAEIAITADAQGRALEPPIRATQPVLRIPQGEGLAIVSDIDDTVLHTAVTSLRRMVALTLLENSASRRPIPGTAALYAALQDGPQGFAPIFYISSSPSQLHDKLQRFLDAQDIPRGPMFLRRLDGMRDLLRSGDHRQKLEHTLALVERFPERRWLLIGDSGQQDAELYAEAARKHPARIAAIYIRDVEDQREADTSLRIACVYGTEVPLVRVGSSSDIARHAAEQGWMDADALETVIAQTAQQAQ